MGLKIKELLFIAENRLKSGGNDSPKVDSNVLLEHFLQRDKKFIFMHMGDELDDERCEEYLKIIDERALGKPLQYITQNQEFMGLRFYVDKRVLIPRQETEVLVEHIIENIKNRKKSIGKIRILDVCTGSGAIGISLAKKIEKSLVTATDISRDALSVAGKNVEAFGLSKKIDLVQGDMFTPFKLKKNGKGKKTFDIMVSNPPYIESDIMSVLESQVVDFEPRIALDGGSDGLKFYRIIAENAWRFLDKNGTLFIEIGHDQGERVPELLEESGHYHGIQVIKDLAGRDRVVEAKV